MSEIPYTNLAGKIPKYFQKIQEAGVPQKVDYNWLNQCGFKSRNDRYILQVLKFIGFIDESKNPTELWVSYKSPATARAALAKGIRSGYSDLFSLYPQANRKAKDDLYAYFSSKTGKAKNTVDLIVNTFINLCQLADFEAEAPKETKEKQENEEKANSESGIKSEKKKQIIPQITEGFAVNMNIQITLPVTEDAKVYENIFKALREQLFKSD
ncbi:MAG: DUF5343 domain-containing protein [Candidatus Bathyarchaeota archaeon]|nr:DUF5343 domain-containing protein [Candidatus Bathyarchaeota archaeon]